MRKKILLKGFDEKDLTDNAIKTLSKKYGPEPNFVGTHPKNDEEHATDCRIHRPVVVVFYPYAPPAKQPTYEGIPRAVVTPDQDGHFRLKYLPPSGSYI